ncbi:MAG: hypothetical protein ACI3W8_06760 [Oscillospiraceae bacterium]
MLHLYDEAIAFSGLHFLPAATCDAIYYVDPYDRNRYISLDCYFSTIQEAQLAELQHIAFSLGAKKYEVELAEVSKKKSTFKGDIQLNAAGHGDGHAVVERDKSTETKNSSLAKATFASGRKPSRPYLLWYAHDNNIKNLIDMRCSEENGSKMPTYEIRLNSSSVAVISTRTAAEIDAAAGKLGMKSNFSTQCATEHSKVMYLKLEF